MLVRRGVALIPEGGRVFARQTVEKNLRLGAYVVAEEAVRRERVDRVFALFPRLAERRLQVAFIAAKCLLYAGKADKALPIYEKLVKRHAGKYEELEALGGAVSCHAKLEEVGKVKQKLLQIDLLIPKMPEEARGRRNGGG